MIFFKKNVRILNTYYCKCLKFVVALFIDEKQPYLSKIKKNYKPKCVDDNIIAAQWKNRQTIKEKFLEKIMWNEKKYQLKILSGFK